MKKIILASLLTVGMATSAFAGVERDFLFSHLVSDKADSVTFKLNNISDNKLITAFLQDLGAMKVSYNATKAMYRVTVKSTAAPVICATAETSDHQGAQVVNLVCSAKEAVVNAVVADLQAECQANQPAAT